MKITTLFLVCFFASTFNWNLPLLSPSYRGISRYRFIEWLFLGWLGRIILGYMFCNGYFYISRPDGPPTTFGQIFPCILLAIANFLVTKYEIKRDAKRFQRKSLYYRDRDL